MVQAQRAGMEFGRIESLNVMPRFIDALASVATDRVGASLIEPATAAPGP